MSSLSLVELKAVLVYEETAKLACTLISRRDLRAMLSIPNYSPMAAIIEQSLGAWAGKIPAEYFYSTEYLRKLKVNAADACGSCGRVFADTFGGRLRESCLFCLGTPSPHRDIYWHVYMLSNLLPFHQFHLEQLIAQQIKYRYSFYGHA